MTGLLLGAAIIAAKLCKRNSISGAYTYPYYYVIDGYNGRYDTLNEVRNHLDFFTRDEIFAENGNIVYRVDSRTEDVTGTWEIIVKEKNRRPFVVLRKL